MVIIFKSKNKYRCIRFFVNLFYNKWFLNNFRCSEFLVYCRVNINKNLSYRLKFNGIEF